MSVYNEYQLFGIGIQAANTRFQGLGIETANTRFQGLTIDAGNFFNSNILVTDKDATPIQGATVQIVSTQTHPNNYEGDITGTTNTDGIIPATGSSTTGTTVTVTKENFQTAVVGLSGLNLLTPMTQTIVLYPPTGSGNVSKKVYTTNKGNILINPNDTILIELD
tara:strand:+ start:381 stop:875 length:495 start_codon:yes stop_codon:yes gene_type:complete